MHINCTCMHAHVFLLTPFERSLCTELSLTCKRSSVINSSVDSSSASLVSIGVGIPSIPGVNSISNKNICDLIVLNRYSFLLCTVGCTSPKFRLPWTNPTHSNDLVACKRYCFFYTKSCLRYKQLCAPSVCSCTFHMNLVSLAGRYALLYEGNLSAW